MGQIVGVDVGRGVAELAVDLGQARSAQAQIGQPGVGAEVDRQEQQRAVVAPFTTLPRCEDRTTRVLQPRSLMPRGARTSALSPAPTAPAADEPEVADATSDEAEETDGLDLLPIPIRGTSLTAVNASASP